MTSSLPVNWKCNDFPFGRGRTPKCHGETQDVSISLDANGEPGALRGDTNLANEEISPSVGPAAC